MLIEASITTELVANKIRFVRVEIFVVFYEKKRIYIC